MKIKAATAILALAISGMTSHAYAAVDGCALALCIIKGGSAYNECKPILKQFYKDTALGRPPPQCKKMGGGDNSGSANSAEQYTQATAGAGAVASGTPDANPYGEAMADKYSAAQTSSVEAAASATVAVNSGARTADASAVLSSDSGSAAVAQSGDATNAASAAVAASPTCLDASCTLIVSVKDVDASIAIEADQELADEQAASSTP